MESESSEILSKEISYKPINDAKLYDEPMTASSSDYATMPDSAWSSKEEHKLTFNSDCKITVFDVASYVIKQIGEMTTMKLQKLVYYCQAWSLVWDDEPLFPEKIEAWANGPVVRELFDYHKGQFKIESISIGSSDCLSENQKETIDKVIKYYGNKKAQWLTELTHMESPWIDARKGLSVMERGERIISLSAMVEFYSSL